MSREIGNTENYRTHKDGDCGNYYVTFPEIVSNVDLFLLCFTFSET
jgi:hypothetical protein